MRRSACLALLAAASCSRGGVAPTDPIASTPLAVRAESTGPRFRRVSGADSGIDFRNELRRENVIAYVYSGAGLAVGDYDNDGLPDLYLVSQDGRNRLFRQVAPFRFEDVTKTAGDVDGGDAWGKAATFVDIDGDNDLDLYVCNTQSKNLLYQNQGDGTFVERAAALGLASTSASTGAAFADYDNDGDLDAFVLTNRVFGPNLPLELVADVTLPSAITASRQELFPPFPEFTTKDGAPVIPPGHEELFEIQHGRVFPTGQRDRLLRNDGPVGFVDVSAASGVGVVGNGLGCVWWDFDDDGRLDLYVSNDIHSKDRLWRNRGDGTFEDVAKAALPHTAFFGMGCDFGDLDNDGRFDLWVADMSSRSHYMGKMLMGSMGNHRWFLMNAEPPQYMRNALYRNVGGGKFTELAHMAMLASTDWTWSVRLVDLDEDGLLDAHATNGISVFEDNPDTIDSFKRLVQAGRKNEALDLARRMQRVDEPNVCKKNLGGFAFADVGAEWGLDEVGVSHGAVFCDLDRDGDLDCVTNNLNQQASVFENRTVGTHRVLVSLQGRGKNRHGIGARIELTAGSVTQSRLVSPVRGYMSGNEAVEHFGLGSNARIDTLVVRWPSGVVQNFAGLDADRSYFVREPDDAARAVPCEGRTALSAPWFEPQPDLPFLHRERAFDDYAVQPLLPHRLSQLGPSLAFGDVDGDGRDEVFVGGAAGQSDALLHAREGGRFDEIAGPWRDDAECEDMGAVFLDFDSDGDLDLFVGSGGVEAIERTELLRDRLYVNDGNAAFSRAPDGALPDLRISTGPVAAGDYDGDGDLDLFVGARVKPGRFPESQPSALLRNDGGRFVDASDEVLGPLRDVGMVAAATFCDLDGDRKPELVVAAQWDRVRAWKFESGRCVDATDVMFADAPKGQWQSLLLEDLDGDGDADLVAGNIGLNTKYHATRDHLLRIYAADFDRSGTLDVIEAKESGAGALLPVRGLSCSSDAIPAIRTAFPTYDRFARATLSEIYGTKALAAAKELVCDELQSLVFENRAGRLFALPLPRMAQIAPLQGCVANDFDGDGVLDLVLAQNSFAPEPETGRFDGGLGLLLRGRGGMQFEAVEPSESGILLGGDQKALACADLDGDAQPDLVLTQNDGPVRVLAGRRGSRPIAVRLRGQKGNPQGVGAVVALVGPDGMAQTRRILAGSGYLTHAAPVAFFHAPEGRVIARVTWPDGAVTEQEIAASESAIVVARESAR